ncbi:MAG: MarR family winged helix-turn-helix transcriptional regulator [Actinomycetes bacterium]
MTTEDGQLVRIENAVGELLRLTASSRVHEALVSATGIAISRTNSRLLAYVEERGPISVSKIAAVLDVSQPTASRSLQQLEEEGLVARESDPADGRVVVYAVTQKGRKARQKLRQHMHDQLGVALSELDDDRTTEIADALDELVDRLRGRQRTASSPR